MDEIDQAIADFEAAQAARAAKKNQKKRGNATLETEVAVTPAPDQDTQSESNDEVAQPPPLKKQKLNKKAQKRAFNAIYASQVAPTFHLMMHNLKGGEDQSLGMKDVRALITAIVAKGPAIVWADVRSQSLIKHVVLISVDSLSHELFLEASAAGKLPYLIQNFQYAPSRAPGNATRVFEGSSVLLRHSISKNQLKTLKNARNLVLSTSFPANDTSTEDAKMDVDAQQDNSEDPQPAPSKVHPSSDDNPSTTIEELASRLSQAQSLSAKSVFDEVALLSPGESLLSHNELVANQYPLPSNITERGFIEIPKYHVPAQKTEEKGAAAAAKYHLLAIDCEMCRTTAGIELTRVVVVNKQLEVVYDTYSKPAAQVLDHMTRFSGITEEHLKNVTVRVEQVQKDLLTMIQPHTILIGHSLENDLKALKLCHQRVVDTALLYPHARGDRFKNSLKFLAENWLGEIIQTGHHHPAQDARTAMKLALLKFRQGAGFGNIPLADAEENYCEYLSRLGKRTAIIDTVHRCKSYAGSHTDLSGEESADQIVKKAKNAFSSCRYDFAYARLATLERYYASLELKHVEGHNGESSADATASSSTDDATVEQKSNANCNHPEPSLPSASSASSTPATLSMKILEAFQQPDRATELDLCQTLDDQVRDMCSSLPKRSLVIVTGGNGNLSRIRTILNLKRTMQNSMSPWSEADDAAARLAFEKARETITFFCVTPDSKGTPAAE